ncbi:flagellar protein FlaG [Nitrosophilus kaiyonis]|uniref:flagellar protein FlaG n=1 Tax=Nitrosophilus kaiyonis TaxID=2930200 RepID=UPI00249062A9|nr:flagellar protein FlaG [Nitrosophilus kaiyonis]
MDVKAVNSTSAALQMQSQNVNQDKSIQTQENNLANNQDKADSFKNLDKKVQNEIIQKSIEDLNKKMSMLNSQLKIEIDEDTGIQVVKIIDKETKEVIRQLPPDVILKIAKYIDEVTGLLFNEKA